MKIARPILFDFVSAQPKFRYPQSQLLDWLSYFHGGLDDKLFTRLKSSQFRIGHRFSDLADFQSSDPKDWGFYGKESCGSSARTQAFDTFSKGHMAELYKNTNRVPHHIFHVTCTGYTSPSPVQSLVSKKKWNGMTEVTHFYHMGCYGAFPAIRLARESCLANQDRRLDVVHTELCSLHLEKGQVNPEKIIIQSLFGDGNIKYSVAVDPTGKTPGLEVLDVFEFIVPDSQKEMSWRVGDQGMAMTLSSKVPQVILENIEKLLMKFLGPARRLNEFLFAIHPGGPRIIDSVQRRLTLTDDQVRHSNDILFKYGNMSSATLPHIWKEIVEDTRVPSGKSIVSMAFGPGLTIFLGLFRKIS